MTDILSTFNWPTNADMIADVAKLGPYLDGTVFDATYGEGKFWTRFKPTQLITNDLHKDAHCRYDYTNIPQPDNCVDSAVFDPDYKFTGTPSSPSKDFRYGTDKPMRWQDRLANIEAGARECYRVSSSYTLIKCQDQIVSGKLVLQTRHIMDALDRTPVEWLNFLHTPPRQRSQKHARRNYSTLLIFKKTKR